MSRVDVMSWMVNSFPPYADCSLFAHHDDEQKPYFTGVFSVRCNRVGLIRMLSVGEKICYFDALFSFLKIPSAT